MLGRVFQRRGFNVYIGETFGAAQRGGPVHSSLRVSRRRQYGPLIPAGRAHLVVGLEPMETLRALVEFGGEHTVVITNTRPVLPTGVLAGRAKYPPLDRLLDAIRRLSKKCWAIDVNELAMKLGSPLVTNTVLMGYLLGTGELPIELQEVEREVRDSFPPEKAELNLRGLRLGLDAIETDWAAI
jgi:indolepyruvate ferredoxin oxidoreductase beta subunit